MNDSNFMNEALTEARKAYEIGEVPIGCVIVSGGKIIAKGHNRRVTEKNVLHHAEIIAINEACNQIQDWRLDGCRLYVTIEPCAMCAGAILQARVKTVIFGARNTKGGCVGSVLDLLREPRFNHQAEIIEGVLAEECGSLMTEFFTRFRT